MSDITVAAEFPPTVYDPPPPHNQRWHLKDPLLPRTQQLSHLLPGNVKGFTLFLECAGKHVTGLFQWLEES